MSSPDNTPDTAETYQHDVEREHSFDGIVEYDNMLPRWIVAILVLTVGFSAAYAGYYHFAGGKLGPDHWAHSEKVALEARLANQSGPIPEADLVAMLDVSEYIAEGEKAYAKANCQQCHLNDLKGNIGPNLTDDYWIHGNSLTEIIDVITNGRQGAVGAMQPQKFILSPTEIRNAALYVVSVNKRTATTGGKAPGRNPDGELQPIEY